MDIIRTICPIYLRLWPTWLWLCAWSHPMLPTKKCDYWHHLRITLRKGYYHSDIVFVFKKGEYKRDKPPKE